jgi:hypothetical protein
MAIPDEIRGRKYIDLATFRSSGAALHTPVWFAEANGKLYVMTSSKLGKYKRIRNNPRVTMPHARCGAKSLDRSFRQERGFCRRRNSRRRANCSEPSTGWREFRSCGEIQTLISRSRPNDQARRRRRRSPTSNTPQPVNRNIDGSGTTVATRPMVLLMGP